MGIITITQDGKIYSDRWPASPRQAGAKGLLWGADTCYLQPPRVTAFHVCKEHVVCVSKSLRCGGREPDVRKGPQIPLLSVTQLLLSTAWSEG